MASCSSTTVLLHGAGEPDVSFPASMLESSSLEELLALVRRESSVSAWKELPLTERLEIAESLLYRGSANSEETVFKLLSLLALFSCAEDASPSVRRLSEEALDRLSDILPPHATARKYITRSYQPSNVVIARWLPPAIVVSVSIALLYFGPRISTVVV